jgi:transcriptional regulator with XRE-family HTH domain
VDYPALSAALVARVRGSMSQEQLSRRLGYGSNVLYLWERRRRLPPVGVFFRMAELRRHPLRSELARFLGPNTAAAAALRAGGAITPLLLRWMRGELSNVELAKLSGFDRSTVARWLSGKTEPRLPDFLALLDRCSLRLLEFVALFVDPAELPMTRDAYDVAQGRQRLAYELPWSNAVMHALELAAYRRLPRHRPQVLAEHLGLPVAEVAALLARLAQDRLIEMRDGLWREVRVLSVDTRSDFERNRALKQHWAAVAAERLSQHQAQDRSLFSYNVFPISHADFEALRELHIDYYQRVRQLVARASGADHVVVMNAQLFTLDEVRVPSGSGVR